MLTKPIERKLNQSPPAERQQIDRAVRLIVQANGGWGRQVDAALKRRLTGDPRAEGVKSLVIDTDVSGMETYGVGEAYALDGVPIRKMLTRMMRDAEAYARYRPLFDGYLRKLWQTIGATDDISLGAMMTRPLGRTAFEWHLERHPELRASLVSQARQVNRYCAGDGRCTSGDGLGQDELPITICRVQSMIGGNGSAIHQLVADVQKHLLAQQGIRHRSISINALPSAFGSLHLLDEDRLRAHAYADTLERMLRYERPLPAWDAGLAGQVERDGPGYEVAYFLEGVNMRGKVYDGPEAVAAVAAEFMRMTMLGGPLADRYTGVTQNVFRHLQPPYVGASFGVFAYEVPIEDIIRQFGFRLGRLGIKQLLRSHPDADLEQSAWHQVGLFLTQSGLQDRGRWFRASPQGGKIRPDVQQFQGRPRADLPRILENYELKKFDDWQTDIDDLVDAIYSDLAGFLDDQVLRLVNAAGLRQARRALERSDGDCLAGALDRLAQGLQRQLERERQQLVTHQRGQARRRGQATWRKLTPAPRRRYLSARQTEFDHKVAVMRLTGQLQVITRLQERVRFLVRELDSWILALEELDQRLAAMDETFAHQRDNHPEFVQHALCPEDEREIFEQHVSKVLVLFLDSLSFTWDGSELILVYHTAESENTGQRRRLLSEAGIRQHLTYACSHWDFLRQELSVEAILHQRGEDPVQLVERWFRYAAPLINIEELDQEKPLIHLMLMGSQHGGDLFWKDVDKPYLTIERTNDPFRIDCLYAVFRLNPWALAQTAAMRADYQRLRADGEPLHAYPETELEEDGLKPAPKKGKKKPKKNGR